MKHFITITASILIAASLCAGCGPASPEAPQEPTANNTTITEDTHVHSYTQTVVPAQCLVNGYIDNTCTCGDSYRDAYVSPTGHQYGEWVVDGDMRQKQCTDCGHLVKEELANLEPPLEPEKSTSHTTAPENTTNPEPPIKEHVHVYTVEVIAFTSCTEPKTERYTCSCGHSYEKAKTSAFGHHYGDFVVVTEATRTSTGERHAFCRDCDSVLVDITPKLTPSDEELYATCIDPKLSITRTPNGKLCYNYYENKIGVWDTRSWGSPPEVRITENDSLHIIYYKADGTMVDKTLDPMDDYFMVFIISEDGGYRRVPIGNFSD